MHYLAEDPWPVAGTLGALGLASLIVLWATQRGKFLTWAGACFGLALLVLAIEQLWVTDEERIEWVVGDLARAVRASDGDAALACMAPEVDVTLGDELDAPSGVLDPEKFRAALAGLKFDLLRVSRLTATVGRQSRKGRARFEVMATGTVSGAAYRQPFGSARSAWELGLDETSPGVWKVSRITPTAVPTEASPFIRAALSQLLRSMSRAR